MVLQHVLLLWCAMQNHLMEMDAKKAAAPTWETVCYMISSIQYGGRITDDFDQLLMDTFALKYFNDKVLAVSHADSVGRLCWTYFVLLRPAPERRCVP